MIVVSALLFFTVMLYYDFFIYGFYISSDLLMDIDAEVSGDIVNVTADTSSPAFAYAGFESFWIVDDLVIQPRYSFPSNVHRSGRLDIAYDTGGHRLHKVYLTGVEENSREQVWPKD